MNEFGTELSFYVVNQLAGSPNGKTEISRFDILEEAIKTYKEFPKEWHSALGGSLLTDKAFGGVSEIDFVQRHDGEDVLICDYQKVEAYQNLEEMGAILFSLEKGLGVQYQYESDIIPQRDIYCKIDKREKLNDYLEDKLLLSKNRNLIYGINEVMVENKGWMSLEDFQEFLKEAELKKEHVKIQLINVSYLEPASKHQGQADISPVDFRLFKEKAKEYLKEHGNSYFPSVEKGTYFKDEGR